MSEGNQSEGGGSGWAQRAQGFFKKAVAVTGDAIDDARASATQWAKDHPEEMQRIRDGVRAVQTNIADGVKASGKVLEKASESIRPKDNADNDGGGGPPSLTK